MVGVQEEGIAARQELRRFLAVMRDLPERSPPGVEVFA